MKDVDEEVGEFTTKGFGTDEMDVLFVDEIDAGFDAGEEIGDFFGGFGDPFVEVAAAEAGGGAELGFVGGVDGGGDSFGLSEVDFSVEESAGGEFAGVCEAGDAFAVFEERGEDGLEQCGGVGEMEFGDVLAGEAARGLEEKGGGEFGGGVEERENEICVPTDGGPGGEVDDGGSELPGVGAAEADDAARAVGPPTGWGADGEDGVGEAHCVNDRTKGMLSGAPTPLSMAHIFARRSIDCDYFSSSSCWCVGRISALAGRMPRFLRVLRTM